MVAALQSFTAKAIINVFETGRILGDYSAVTLIQGDTGGLTYGRSQTTLNSGGLGNLVTEYVYAGGLFGRDLEPYLRRLQRRDGSLNRDTYFQNLLRTAADDPIMRDAQDVFFDSRYWEPSLEIAENGGIGTALGKAVIYDSLVHGSWPAMRDRTNDAVGRLGLVDEQVWIKAYVQQRAAWLKGHTRRDLRTTVYRMNTFQQLIDANLWDLALPLNIRNRKVSEFSLASDPDGVFSGPAPYSRTVGRGIEPERGFDVRLVQLALSRPANGEQDVVADGIFGFKTEQAIATFQRGAGLGATGTADANTMRRLGVPQLDIRVASRF